MDPSLLELMSNALAAFAAAVLFTLLFVGLVYLEPGLLKFAGAVGTVAVATALMFIIGYAITPSGYPSKLEYDNSRVFVGLDALSGLNLLLLVVGAPFAGLTASARAGGRSTAVVLGIASAFWLALLLLREFGVLNGAFAVGGFKSTLIAVNAGLVAAGPLALAWVWTRLRGARLVGARWSRRTAMRRGEFPRGRRRSSRARGAARASACRSSPRPRRPRLPASSEPWDARRSNRS